MDNLIDPVSVVIRNKNEAQHIGLAIQSIHDHIGSSAEIIIVDDNSTDDSLRVVALFDKMNISIQKIEGGYSPGKAINQAIKQATYSKVLVLSAHAQITKINLEYVFSMLGRYKAIFGHQTPIYRGKKISPRYIWSHFVEEEVKNMFSSIENRPFLHNAFCFYSRDFLLHNPFDEKLVGKEDRYWAIDLIDNGHEYLYTPSLRANHYWTTNGATWKGLG